MSLCLPKMSFRNVALISTTRQRTGSWNSPEGGRVKVSEGKELISIAACKRLSHVPREAIAMVLVIRYLCISRKGCKVVFFELYALVAPEAIDHNQPFLQGAAAAKNRGNAALFGLASGRLQHVTEAQIRVISSRLISMRNMQCTNCRNWLWVKCLG
jgi:hypothetical protein